MPPKESGSSTRSDAGCVPASEEQVYLYSKSGAERIAELEEKRGAYEALDAALETLPRKLQHPGLIPLGPGLFARGSLVRTNEVLVLLGDSYFAERSAYQAREIVHRRLQVIDTKIAEVEVGKSEVAAALSGGSVDANAELQKQAPVCAPPPTPEPLAASAKLNVTAKKPPASKGRGAPSDVSGRRPPRSPRPSTTAVAAGQNGDLGGGSGGGGGKRVSFAAGTKGGSEGGGTGGKSPSDTVREMLANFGDSVKQAEEISRESGTVNIVEEYDAQGVLKNVQVPEQNRPENVIVTEEDEIEDLFDMTRPKERGADLERKDFLKVLIQAEREEELEQARKAAERAERVRKKEVKEFGGGFAKGFFGKKEKGSKAIAGAPKGILKKSALVPLESAVPEVVEEEMDVADKEREEEAVLGRQALGNTVVEREAGTRRRRRKPAPVKEARAPIMNIATMKEKESMDDDIEEEEVEQPLPRVSKFKQMRALEQR